jgi:hypothetical protein
LTSVILASQRLQQAIHDPPSKTPSKAPKSKDPVRKKIIQSKRIPKSALTIAPASQTRYNLYNPQVQEFTPPEEEAPALPEIDPQLMAELKEFMSAAKSSVKASE